MLTRVRDHIVLQSQRQRQRRWLPVSTAVLTILAAHTATAASATKHANPPNVRGERRTSTASALRDATSTQTRTPPQATIHFGPSRSVRHFVLTEPAGTIKLLRLIVPHGDRARLTGNIPGIAEITISTTAHAPNPVCEPSSTATICSEQEEQCPMPAATWRFRLQQSEGPGGTIRVEFKVD